MKKIILLLVLCMALMISAAGCGGNTETTETPNAATTPVSFEELNLKIGSAPGPVTYPLATMSEKNSNIVLQPWQSGEQLTAMITSKEVNLSSTPLSNALLTYNKGMDTQLLMVTVWGMLYVMSTENDVASLQDLKGKEVIVSGKGSIHDLVFRHLLIKNNIDPDKDVQITYLDMPEASQRLASGQIKYAVLNEPQSSIASLNAKKANVKLNRVLDLTEEWGKLPGQKDKKFPMAGIVVVNGSGVSPEQVAAFEKSYIEEAGWVNEHGQEAGPIVEKHVPSMKAMAVAQSIQYARLDPKPALECKTEIIDFFKELTTTADINAFGGKLPDDEFFYK
ncbi:MAG: ABC transporter substrate-binding protein [Desulfotomaculaceae bacterium]|nr:ABC transporter substrate-binding protein [Desulfotomaculaceae bacterium]